MSDAPLTLDAAVKLHKAGNVRQAIAIYRQILRREPANANAWYLLGLAFQATRDLDRAIASYRRALQIQPEFDAALNNLGAALGSQGKLQEAEECYRRVLAFKPGHVETFNNLGNVLRRMERLEEAIACFQQAIRLQPDFLLAYHNLAIAWVAAGAIEQAGAIMQQAVRIKPDDADTHNRLGSALTMLGRLDEAVCCYDRAIELKPDLAEAHFDRALAWLLQGDFERGWAEYEWRWKRPDFKPPPYGQPWWDGSPMPGKRLLLHCEQGLGDAIQFIRYAPLVKERLGGKLIVQCPQPLRRLFTTMRGIDQLASPGEPAVAFDVQLPLLSVPRVMKTTLATVPAVVPYLAADNALVRQWREKLDAKRGFRVGIFWEGSQKHPKNRFRSMPLALFEPLARVPGVRLFSLQRDAGREQLAVIGNRFRVVDLGHQLDDFLTTAAALKNLNLVVTIDTAVAHLAGALALPVWVLLSCDPDWRWMLQRDDTPWYPTMRLFRQRAFGKWEEVMQRVAQALPTMARCS
jgi:tetratricopeptide (TPR) repeat protein